MLKKMVDSLLVVCFLGMILSFIYYLYDPALFLVTAVATLFLTLVTIVLWLYYYS